ncbi:hypothetical protein IEO21_07790 [Rhodonia placenta]|uniref:Uncharacterized protein n=1 Tax=Rhodonia placenta TaxID=104341 RepID=A0A8H7NXG4_9APHY|nr:hypothetical protein IEO21_07790 [Postia placenta]
MSSPSPVPGGMSSTRTSRPGPPPPPSPLRWSTGVSTLLPASDAGRGSRGSNWWLRQRQCG